MINDFIKVAQTDAQAGADYLIGLVSSFIVFNTDKTALQSLSEAVRAIAIHEGYPIDGNMVDIPEGNISETIKIAHDTFSVA